MGKSSIALGYLQEKKIDPARIFFVNKELDVNNSIATVDDLHTLFEAYVQTYGEPTYILIDEIQDIQNRERFVRALFTYKRYKIIIT